ncbi:MAG: hypothetical protein AAGI38_16125 [Bacteroidota bacterium]
MDTANFLWACKQIYFLNIHPFDTDKVEDENYEKVVQIGQIALNELGTQNFLGYLLEGQYRVELWAAMIFLETKNIEEKKALINSPNQTAKYHCIQSIEKYITSPHISERRKQSGSKFLAKLV